MCIHKHNYVLVFQVRDSSPAAFLHRGGESRGSSHQSLLGRGTLPKVGSVRAKAISGVRMTAYVTLNQSPE